MLSINKNGHIIFNTTLAKALTAMGVVKYAIFFDEDTSTVALGQTTETDPDGYKFKMLPKGNGGSTSAKTFFTAIKMDLSKEHKYPVEVDSTPGASYFIQFQISAANFLS